ncbi:MAG TPA: alkaline phosphatase family protein [Solirubrobacterales bacterium]|nr:alkaline phosphatase family protein [Solirubrobacterales bacterium]
MIGKTCSECGAKRAPDQRYCLKCGARLGSLPTAIVAHLQRLRTFATGRIPVIKPPAARKPGAEGAEKRKGWPYERSDFMPSPRAAAAAVIGMLALGVALGSATNNLAQSAGLTTILVEEPAPSGEEETAPEVAAEPEVEAEAPAEEATAAAAPAVPIPQEPAIPEEAAIEEPKAPEVPIEEEVPTGMPEVEHVFLIVLGENGYEEIFGERSQSPYFKEELPGQGELLTNYYAVTKGELANEIAIISGQGPTPETAANCPAYADVSPGTESAEGQVEGNGCAYSTTTKTLPDQLAEKELTWRAYVDRAEIEETPLPTNQPAGCFATWRNPFAYFHSIVDAGECDEGDPGLAQLAKALALKPEKFPTLAYISPAPPTPANPTATEEELKTIIPSIQSSFAYKDGGLIVITSAQAPQEGEGADASSCCISPEYPNLPPAESKEEAAGPVKETGGGGRVGAVLLSPFIEPGTTSETYFNHFSLLATIEELFSLEKIGYATEPAITGFDESIFNAGS